MMGHMRASSDRVLEALLGHCMLSHLYFINICILQTHNTRKMLKFPSWERGDASALTYILLFNTKAQVLSAAYFSPLAVPFTFSGEMIH